MTASNSTVPSPGTEDLSKVGTPGVLLVIVTVIGTEPMVTGCVGAMNTRVHPAGMPVSVTVHCTPVGIPVSVAFHPFACVSRMPSGRRHRPSSRPPP